MKHYNLLIISQIFILSVAAQTTNKYGIYTEKTEIEDIEMGWMKKLSFTSPAKPYTLNGWNYPANQVEISEKIASWIQDTYKPTGVLGEISLDYLNTPSSKLKGTKSYNYNELEKDNKHALPNSYGALVNFHVCLSKTNEKRFWPTSGNKCYHQLHIRANALDIFTQQLVTLSSPTEYYFTMPTYKVGDPGLYDKESIKKKAAYRNFEKSDNLKKYQHYFNPADLSEAYVIIMTKDNKPLPIEQVTVAEFLNQLEKQFPVLHQLAINQNFIYENYLENSKKGMQILKRLLKDNLQDYVYLKTPNQIIEIKDLADIGSSEKLPYWFSTNKNPKNTDSYGNIINVDTYFPVYRLKKGVKEACAKGEPQWIVFSLSRVFGESYGGTVRVMDDFINNFNYDYVYNYFFGKEKPTTAYKSNNSTSTVSNIKSNNTSASLSETAKKKKDDASILFFEDFSSLNEGSTPGDWTTQKNNEGNSPTIVKIKNDASNWLRLQGITSPKNLKYPLKGDFEISYDVLVQKGEVPWGTPGIEMELVANSKEGEKIYLVSATPGDMNRDNAEGWIELMLGGMAQCKTGNYFSTPDFKGSQNINKVKIRFVKKGEAISIYCNKQKVYECANAFLPEMSFSKLNFKVNHKNVYHLSNVEIKKL